MVSIIFLLEYNYDAEIIVFIVKKNKQKSLMELKRKWTSFTIF